MDLGNMLLGADAADNVDAKCVKQMKDGRRGGGKVGRRWEEGKVKQMKDGEGKVGKGANGKMGRCKQRIRGRSFTPRHSGSHQQNGAGGGVGGDNTQVENNSP